MSLQNNKDFKNFMAATISALNRSEIKDAISRIRGYLTANPDAAVSDRLGEIELSYRYLLQYFLEGQADPQRDNLLSQLREKLYDIVRSLEYSENLRDSPELYFCTARNVRLQNKTLEQLLERRRTFFDLVNFDNSEFSDVKLLRKFEEAQKDLFDYIWTLPPSRTRDLKLLAATASDPETDHALASLIVGALTLGALRIYDREKLNTLLDIDENGPQKLSARTLTGIILILRRFGRSIEFDNNMRLRFETWADNLMNYRRLREVIFDFIRTSGSLQLAREVQSDVIPEIMKAGPDFLEKMKNEQGMISLTDIEENPEWEEMLRNSGVMDKMRRLESLHRDGADLMLMGIGQMKQMAFFNHVHNWLLPFSFNNSEIMSSLGDTPRQIVEILEDNDLLCDSDKYSFSLMLAKFPEEQRNRFRDALTMQQEQAGEEMKEMMLKSSTPEFDREALNYIRSIYRFYNFFRLKREFPSPFDRDFNFTALPFIGNMLKEREIVESVAEHYLRRRKFADSAALFKLIAEDNNEGALYEKIGYCALRMGNPKEALEYFEKAELLNSDSAWLKRNISKAAELAGQWLRAAEYLEPQLEEDPDSVPLLKRKADLLMKGGAADEASKVLFKIDYLSPGDNDVMLGLGRIALANGDYAKAAEKFDTIIAAGTLANEKIPYTVFLNAGNAKFGKGQVRAAADHYRQAMEAEGSTIKDRAALREFLEDEWKSLDPEVFRPSLVPLLVDAI